MRALLLLVSAVIAAPAFADSNVVDAVTVSGNSEISTAVITARLHLKAGDTLAGPDQVKADVAAIVALYRSNGHDLAVSPDIAHPAPGHVTITYKINEAGHGGDAGAAPPGGPPPGGPPPAAPPAR